MNRRYELIALGGMLILTLFSILFYQERTLLTDTAYYLFRMSTEMSFNVELNRWSAVLPEILPLLMMYMKQPTQWVLLSYSLSFWLLFLGLFILMVKGFKNTESGIALILAFTFFLRQSYFHSVTETHQAVAWSLLLYAWLMYGNADKKIVYSGVALLICVPGYFSHPVSLFMQLFAIAYAGLNRNMLKHQGLWMVVLALFGLYLAKVLSTESASYEGNFFGEIRRMPEHLPGLLHSFGVKFIVHHFFDLYLLPFLSGILLLAVYLKEKRYLHLTLYVIGTALFLMITLTAYHAGDADIMTEKNLMPLSVFLALPFVRDVLMNDNIPYARFKTLWLSLCIVFGLWGIYNEGLHQGKRLVWMKCNIDAVKASSRQKVYTVASEINFPNVGPAWALSHETLWYSSLLYGPEGVATIYTTPALDQLPTEIQYDDLYLSVSFWPVYGVANLNPTYFQFKPERYTPVHSMCR